MSDRLQRTPLEWIMYWSIIVVLLSPGIPIAIGWYRLLSRGDLARGSRVAGVVSQAILTASYVLVLLVVCGVQVLGGEYSKFRYAIIYANLAGSAIGSAIGVAGSVNARVPRIVAGFLLLISWAYLLVVNSAV